MWYALLFAAYLIFPVIGLYQMNLHKPNLATVTISEDGAIASEEYLQGKRLFHGGLLSIVFAFVSVIPLMGLPGAVVLTIGQFFGLGKQLLEGDKAWPAAILASILFPLGISIGLLLNIWMGRFTIPIVLVVWGFITILILMQLDKPYK